jgi:toluene monooxygenase system ferredoxin subunit
MMPEKASFLEWIAVATLDNLWEGEMIDVRVGDELILLVHLPGSEIRAYQGHCPHQKTALADGKLEGRILTCAAHLWQFDVSTGEGVNPRSCRLERYDVKIEDAAICVRIPRAAAGGNSDGRNPVAEIRGAGAPWDGRGDHRGAPGRYCTGQP